MAVLVTELVTVIGSVVITEQRNEVIRLSSDGRPGYRPGYPGWKYRGNTEERNKP
jgi:hypothetical protein